MSQDPDRYVPPELEYGIAAAGDYAGRGYEPDWDDLRHDDAPPKEEPDCGHCTDSGVVAARWWSRTTMRPCPACRRPDWWDRLTAPVGMVGWRARHRWHRIRSHRAGAPKRACNCSDEAPF